ncbi:hypothetical protein V8C42DRAFT_120694 [Trichoderma barbatum]
MALQDFSQPFLFSHEQKSTSVFAFSKDLAWRGTSGCTINITSGSRRHMTPKWASKRRVDGILRFAMSSPASCCSQKASQTRAHRCSQRMPYRVYVYMCERIDDGGKSGRLASKEAADKGFLGPSTGWE